MRQLITIVAPLLWAWPAHGDSPLAEHTSCGLFDHEHAAWTQVLERYVSDGWVDYATLKERGQDELNAYLGSLAAICGGHYDTWTREQKLAFWINAYNAYTIRLIVDHYPVKSIRSIGWLPGAPFGDEFIPLTALRGEKLSLDDIEHEILRKDFAEPRIHFAIVCAAKGCPALRSEAYRAVDLNAQLDEAARVFVRSRNQFDPGSRTLYLSPIFDWFRDDFERSSQTLVALVSQYADASTKSALRDGAIRIKFADYDWSLNGR